MYFVQAAICFFYQFLFIRRNVFAPGSFLLHREWAERGMHRGGCTVTSLK